jgi:soluble lytic murein transglycosylase-like protein
MRPLARAFGVGTVATGLLVAAVASRLSAPVPEVSNVSGNPFLARGPLATSWPDALLPHVLELRPPLGRGQARDLLEAVGRSAGRFGLDPVAVVAVISVESHFDPAAVSPRGAIGLMQVLPETGRELAAELGIEWTSDELLFDPELNILIGTCYLRRLLDRFGDPDRALAAFHAGPTRIRSRLDREAGFSLRYADRVLDVLFELRSRLRT